MALVITGANGDAGAMAIVNAAVPVPAAFVAEIVALVFPAAVGVPEITPVRVLSMTPRGKGAAA